MYSTHTDTDIPLLVLFIYSEVSSITVYTVCTQPGDLMSPEFYLRHWGGKNQGLSSQSSYRLREGSFAQGNMARRTCL